MRAWIKAQCSAGAEHTLMESGGVRAGRGQIKVGRKGKRRTFEGVTSPPACSWLWNGRTRTSAGSAKPDPTLIAQSQPALTFDNRQFLGSETNSGTD